MAIDPERPELHELLELENDPGFTSVLCPKTGIPAWPAIRNEVLRLLIGDLLYPTAPIINLNSGASVSRVVLGATRGAVSSLLTTATRSDVVIVATGAGLIPRSGRLFNRFADPFAEALGSRGWTVESLHDDRWPALPRSNPRLTLIATDGLCARIRSQLPPSYGVRSVAADLVDLVTLRAHAIGWDLGAKRRADLRTAAARRLSAYPLRATQARRLLERSRARVLLVEDASFGYRAVLNAVAADQGVFVAEFQHGMITRGHDGYNAHPLITASPAYRKTLPRALLTFGSWWGAQTNLPAEPHAVGNPYRSHVLEEWRPARNRDWILILGDGIETNLHLDLCRQVARLLPDRAVVFRPHPRERNNVPAASGVTIDVEPDLYRSLTRTSALIGEYSTALFEGVGLVPRIAVWDTPKSRFYLGAHPFARFATADDVPSALCGADVDDALVYSLWESDWRTRFESFVDDALRESALD